MRVIWANDKLQEKMLKENEPRSNSKKVKGLVNIGAIKSKRNVQARELEPDRISNLSECQTEIARCGEVEENATPSCRLCGSEQGLNPLNNYRQVLFTAFAVKICDTPEKICEKCSNLIDHTNKFRDMVRVALLGTNSGGAGDSLNSDGDDDSKNQLKNNLFVSKVNIKRTDSKKRIKKTYATCVVCKQKYPSMKASEEYVCSRCKIKRSSERTIACAQCRCVVPSRLMKEHIEKHAKSNLTGRCRLRSLPNNPSSSAQIEDNTIRKENAPRDVGKKCDECGKIFPHPRALLEHKRIIHRDFKQYICRICHKDLKTPEFYEKHLKAHENSQMAQCQSCGKIFKTIKAIERHYAIHTNHHPDNIVF